jgi:hypothetical protein
VSVDGKGVAYMKFYFDESGNFQLPADPGEHRVGIVGGVVIPDSEEAEVFQRFDAFVATLPATAFQHGEPKGRLLGDTGRRAFAELIRDLPGKTLLCPTMLDLTIVVGRPEADVVNLVVAKLRHWQSVCKHDTMRTHLAELAADVAKLSPQQLLRLMGWAQCIRRAIRDSVIRHCGAEYQSDWRAVHFEIDPVEENSGGREETVFRTLLPAWVTSWSHDEPFTTIQDIHTPDHPFIQNWDRPKGIDVGKMFRNNVHYVSSASSKGIQIADMTAALVRRAVIGLASAVSLEDYGFIMTRTIGRPEDACGLFSLAPGDQRDLERRYAGLPDAIDTARASFPGSYSKPSRQLKSAEAPSEIG